MTELRRSLQELEYFANLIAAPTSGELELLAKIRKEREKLEAQCPK